MKMAALYILCFWNTAKIDIRVHLWLMKFGTEMVLVNVKFNWFWIIYIKILRIIMLLRKYLIYLHFNSVNWNCSRVFGI